jgi:hypothetical protein
MEMIRARRPSATASEALETYQANPTNKQDAIDEVEAWLRQNRAAPVRP